MGYPFPKAPLADGTGASPEDMQRIFGSMFETSGILPTIPMVAVKGTSSMAYQVYAGTVVLKTQSGLGLLHSVEKQTVNTIPAPSTGDRTDYIVMDTDGNVSVSQSGAPAGGITLGEFTVPAGVTDTLSAQESFDRNFAIMAGSSTGRLAHWDVPGTTWGGGIGEEIQRYAEQFLVQSDRIVRVDVSISATSDQAGEGWTAFGIEIDGTFRRALHCVYKDGQERTYSATWTTELAAGRHTLTVFTVKFDGSRLVTAPAASASEVNVWDAGVAQ